jgi:hypothetical protein
MEGSARHAHRPESATSMRSAFWKKSGSTLYLLLARMAEPHAPGKSGFRKLFFAVVRESRYFALSGLCAALHREVSDHE